MCLWAAFVLSQKEKMKIVLRLWIFETHFENEADGWNVDIRIIKKNLLFWWIHWSDLVMFTVRRPFSNPAGLSPNSASLESWYHSQGVVDLNPFVGILVSMIMYFFVYWI